MYFVNREKIEETLKHMEYLVERTDGLVGDSLTVDLARQRLAMNLIEGVIDVGNTMIDGFIMRDPGSYEDIIDILNDERVLDEVTTEASKALVALRPYYVREFVRASAAPFEQWCERYRAAFEAFPAQIRQYVETELGPVSAFLPEGE